MYVADCNRATFTHQNQGDNPITVWKAFLSTPTVAELADFTIMLLSITVNQAGLERNFSDLKIKKSCIRNRIKLPRLEKMAKVQLTLELYLIHSNPSSHRLVLTFEHHTQVPDFWIVAKSGKTMTARRSKSFSLSLDMPMY